MPSQHDLHKHQIAVKFSHRVWRQIELASLAKGETPTEYIRSTVTDKVDSVPLTAEDAFLIAKRIKEAEEKGKMV